MKIVFRTDASLEIGTGHVMRCLTLARALREAGADCKFITRAHLGNMADRIAADGFDVSVLAAPNGALPPRQPAHAHWAGVEWTQDAAETRAALDEAPDWLIMDHYAFDARWQRAVLPEGTRLMVIDDLADRSHACDLLLDQNLGRKRSDYNRLLPDQCKLLIGPQYALLRPEFAALRPQSLARRAAPSSGGGFQIMISMGGGEASPAILESLKALGLASLPLQTTVTLLLGGAQAEGALIEETAKTLPCPVNIFEHRSDMAQLMAGADLIIGAAGGTSWERCCLGVPAILLELADNQKDIKKCLIEHGAAWHADVSAAAIAQQLSTVLADVAILTAASAAAQSMCDGQGAARVRRAMLTQLISLRHAQTKDIPFVWHARYDDAAYQYYRSTQIPNLQDHTDWMTRAMTHEDIILGIAELSGAPVAHIRLDRLPNHLDHAEISIYIASAVRGRKLGASVLQAAIEWAKKIGITKVLAEVHTKNAASLHCFLSTGFTLKSKEPSGFLHLTLVPPAS